jgi:hypothetical protein
MRTFGQRARIALVIRSTSSTDPATVARWQRKTSLKPVQRRLAGDRCAVLTPRLQFAGQHRHDRIVAQLIAVVQVFIAKRDPENPLADRRGDLVLDQLLPPGVSDAGRKSIDEPDCTIGRTKEKPSGIRRDAPSIEAGHNFAAFDGCTGVKSVSIGWLPGQSEVVAAQLFSLIRDPDAHHSVR